jgi:hypothetical protein
MLATPSPAARADPPRPYKGAFDFATVHVQVLSPTELLITGSLAGQETHLGRFEGEVTYHVNLADGSFAGSLYKEAANGDLLYETLDGQFTATGSKGRFELTGGTGRFRHATGSGGFTGIWTDPLQTTAHITFSGTIDFDASDRGR